MNETKDEGELVELPRTVSAAGVQPILIGTARWIGEDYVVKKGVDGGRSRDKDSARASRS